MWLSDAVTKKTAALSTYMSIYAIDIYLQVLKSCVVCHCLPLPPSHSLLSPSLPPPFPPSPPPPLPPSPFPLLPSPLPLPLSLYRQMCVMPTRFSMLMEYQTTTLW